MGREIVKTLLIEDDLQMADVLKLILETAPCFDFQVYHAPNFESIWPLLKIGQKTPELIILDLTFNGHLSGIDLIREITKLCSRKSAIVVFTATDNDELMIEAIKHGVQDFIVKGTLSSHDVLKRFRIAVIRWRAMKATEGLGNIVQKAESLIKESEESKLLPPYDTDDTIKVPISNETLKR